jgi:hypothetical protein
VSLKHRLMRVQDVALCICRKWWRPLTCLGLLASAWVNLVVIPWLQRKPIEFDKAALFVTALVAAFAVREWGKAKGSADK